MSVIIVFPISARLNTYAFYNKVIGFFPFFFIINKVENKEKLVLVWKEGKVSSIL